MSFLFLGDVTSLQLWCLINELSFIQEVVRFYNWRWSRKGIHVLSHEVLADCVNATFLNATLHFAFFPITAPDSLTHPSLLRGIPGLTPISTLVELDFLHFVQPQFPHLKDRNNVNISYHFWMWLSNFTCIDMSNPHKTAMMLVLLLAPLFHRWADWHSEHQITCPRSQSKGVVS